MFKKVLTKQLGICIIYVLHFCRSSYSTIEKNIKATGTIYYLSGCGLQMDKKTKGRRLI